MNKVWVILYSYNDYDGEIDQMMTDEESGEYLAFSSQDKAQTYRDSHYQKDKWPHSWKVTEVNIQ